MAKRVEAAVTMRNLGSLQDYYYQRVGRKGWMNITEKDRRWVKLEGVFPHHIVVSYHPEGEKWKHAKIRTSALWTELLLGQRRISFPDVQEVNVIEDATIVLSEDELYQ